MDANGSLATRFEEQRPHLRAVALRMLGTGGDADDAVQEAWLRLARADAGAVEDLRAWLTTVVSRVALNMLRSRTTRREDPLDDRPVVTPDDGPGPEQEAVLADSVGAAMLVVLEHLAPAERLAFVLHDLFAVPFEDIARLLERSPAATRQLASRARRRVQGGSAVQDADVVRRREVVDAFFAAARGGDIETLVGVLHPDVRLRDGDLLVSGARTVATRAAMFSRRETTLHPVLVDGVSGVVVRDGGQLYAVMVFVVRDGVVTEIEVTGRDRLDTLDLAPFLTA